MVKSKEAIFNKYNFSFMFYIAIFMFIQLFVINLKLPVEREGWLSDVSYNWNSPLAGNMAKDIPWGSTWSTGRGKTFYLTHYFMYKFFGIGLFQGRLVTLLTGMVLLWVLFCWTAKYINHQTAALSVLLLMTSFTFWPFIPVVSQDMAHCLYYFVSFCLLYKAVVSQNKLYFIAVGFISGLSVDNSYRGIEIVMCVFIMLFIFRKKGVFLKQALLVGAGSFAALGVWYWLNIFPMGFDNFLKYHISQARTEQNPSLIRMLLNEADRMVLHIRSQRNLAKIEVAYWIVLIFIFLKYRLKDNYKLVSRFIFIWLGVTFVVMSVMSLVDQQISAVYMLHYGIFVSIICAIALNESLKQNRKPALWLLVFILISGMGYQIGRVAVYARSYKKPASGLSGYYERLRKKIDITKNIIGDVEYWYAFPNAQFYGGGFYLIRVINVLRELKLAESYKNDYERAKAMLAVLEKRKIKYIVSSVNQKFTKDFIAQYFPGHSLPAENFRLVDSIKNYFCWSSNPESDPHSFIEVYEILSYSIKE